MKTKFSWVLAAVLIFSLFASPVRAQGTACTLSYEDGLQFNSINFSLQCSESIVDGYVSVDFGDGSSFDALIENGHATFDHNYGYPPYQYDVVVSRDNTNLINIVVQLKPCVVDVVNSGLYKNHVDFAFICAFDGWATFTFGDGSQTDVLFQTNSGSTSHDYAYIQWESVVYTTTLSINNTAVLTTAVVVDNTPKSILYLPVINR